MKSASAEPFSPKMQALIFSSVSINQNVIFIQWIEKFKNKPISIEASDNDAEPFDLS